MKFDPVGEQRCVDSYLRTANACPFQSQRKKHVRVSNHVMVKEIPGRGAEVGDIECPALDRNSQTDLMLFVPFSAQGKECLAGVQPRIGYGDQWRCLIVAPVKSAQ